MTISLPSRDLIKAIYKQQTVRFGGTYQDGDDSKIRAALAWPRMMITTKDGADIFAVAASLMMGFINEKPFIRGNYRLGLSLGILTLRCNGLMLDISNADAVQIAKGLTEERITEQTLIDYFRQKTVPLAV